MSFYEKFVSSLGKRIESRFAPQQLKIFFLMTAFPTQWKDVMSDLVEKPLSLDVVNAMDTYMTTNPEISKNQWKEMLSVLDDARYATSLSSLYNSITKNPHKETIDALSSLETFKQLKTIKTMKNNPVDLVQIKMHLSRFVKTDEEYLPLLSESVFNSAMIAQSDREKLETFAFDQNKKCEHTFLVKLFSVLMEV